MLLRCVILFCFCVCGFSAQAEVPAELAVEATVAQNPQPLSEAPVFRLKGDVERESGASGSPNVGSMVAGLLGVLAIIFVLAWLSKRFNLSVPGASHHMKLVSAMSVGQKEKVVLIEVQGKQLLLGVTPHQVNVLHTYEANEQPQIASNPGKKGEFAQRMQSLLTSGAAQDD